MVTPIGTSRFGAIFTPDKYNDNSPPRYKTEVVFDEGTDLSALEKALATKVQEVWPDPNKRPAGMEKKWPLKTDKNGQRYLRVVSKYQPRVFDAKLSPLYEEALMYDGCRIRVAGYIGSFDEGVNFLMSEVLRVGDGEPVTRNSEGFKSEFASYVEESSAPAAEFSGNAGTSDDPMSKFL